MIDPSKPHFTVVIDDSLGETATLTESPNGELIYTLHPAATQPDSPARVAAYTVLQRAVETLLSRVQREAVNGPHSESALPRSA